MTDAQILTLCVTLLGIFAASWFNNSRLTDIKEVIRAEMKGEFAEIRHAMQRSDDHIARMLADHEQRLNKIEERKQ